MFHEPWHRSRIHAIIDAPDIPAFYLIIKEVYFMSDQILWDCHMHSSFSVDSSTPMEDMVLKSIQQGLTGICFTEHLDPDYPDTPEKIDFSLDIPAYHKQLQTLREKYKDRLDIRFGIEIGLQPHLEDYFRQLLKEYPFDFVIRMLYGIFRIHSGKSCCIF